jgi:hypothetical protein
LYCSFDQVHTVFYRCWVFATVFHGSAITEHVGAVDLCKQSQRQGSFLGSGEQHPQMQPTVPHTLLRLLQQPSACRHALTCVRCFHRWHIAEHLGAAGRCR